MRLKHENNQLRKLIFGTKSERFVPDQNPEQLALELEGQQAKQAHQEVEQITYDRKKKKKNGGSRQPLPESLERVEHIIEPEESTKGLTKIGQEVLEELEYKPGKLFVNKYIRPKYAKPDGGIIIAAQISRPIPKGIPGPFLLAYILTSKYVDHLPCYRQSKMFKRYGYKISDSTIGDWIKKTYELMKPLFEAQKKAVLEHQYLMADETGIKVLDKDVKGKAHSGYLWDYYAPESKILYLNYRSSKGLEGPKQFLKGYNGYLQTDGYHVYDLLGLPKENYLGCLAHLRRKFHEAKDYDKARANYVLAQIQKLYAIERASRDQNLSYEQRHQLRQLANAEETIDELEKWFIENYPQVLPSSPIGKAISYSLNRWHKMKVYLQDGKFEIDNNLVENSIRPIALGRKNWLFAGSHDGAKRAAMIYSFLGTCKLHDINPTDWLADVLRKINDHPVNKIDQLLPQNWKNIKIK